MIGTERIQGAAQGRQADLKYLLEKLVASANLLMVTVGVDAVPAQQASRIARISPPPKATMTVYGDDGHFFIALTVPPGINGEVYHQIQSSSTLPFSVSQDLVTYGPTPATSRTINDPSKEYYWRWRTKYINSDYNEWSSIATAIDSGQVRSIALSTLNTRQVLGVNSPLVQNASSLTVIVQAFTARLGDVEVEYVGGSIAVDSYDNWIIYFEDKNKNGGEVTFLATLDPLVANSSDSNVIVGTIAVSVEGGGLGIPAFYPFQSSCVIEGTLIRLHSGTDKNAEDVVVGDVLLGVDGGEEEVVRVEVIESRPCWTITTQSGAILQGACSHHLLYTPSGSVPISVLNVSDHVLVRNTTENWDDFILTKTPLTGLRTIYRFVTNRTRTYLADGFWSRDNGRGLLV